MPNPITELRGCAPDRVLPPWEARVLAERQANRLLDLQQVDEPAVPEQLIEYLPRVRVRFVPARTFAGTTKWDGRRWLILVNRDDTWGRQRFTMAHELKHVIDHPQQAILYANHRFGSPHLQAERAADYFAACLLMPKAWIKRAFYDDGIRDPRMLARRFQVSTAAMRVRIEQLQLLEPELVAT
jgi:Zn-dependent peptidase ImmA (M78 family)